MERTLSQSSSQTVIQIVPDRWVIMLQILIGMMPAKTHHLAKAIHRRQLTNSFFEPNQPIDITSQSTIYEVVTILVCELKHPLTPIVIMCNESNQMSTFIITTHRLIVTMDNYDLLAGEMRHAKGVGQPYVDICK